MRSAMVQPFCSTVTTWLGATLGRRRHRRDRLVPMRVELLPDRIDLGQRIFLEGRTQLAQRQFNAFAHLLGASRPSPRAPFPGCRRPGPATRQTTRSRTCAPSRPPPGRDAGCSRRRPWRADTGRSFRWPWPARRRVPSRHRRRWPNRASAAQASAVSVGFLREWARPPRRDPGADIAPPAFLF